MGNLSILRIAFILTLSAKCGIAHAEQFKPIIELSGTTKDYPVLRCSALFFAMGEWIGADRMGPETWKNTESSYQSCAALAILIRKSEWMGGSLDHIAETVNRDIQTVVGIYVSRLKENYAREGQAFGNDEIIKSDLQFCEQVAKMCLNAHNQ